MADENQDNILLENVRLSFPALFKSKAINEGDEPKYAAAFLLDKEQHSDLIKALKLLIFKIAIAGVGDKDKTAEMFKKGVIKPCLHEGSSKTYDGYDESNMFVSASSKTRPSVIDRDRSPLTEDDGRPFAGCYVNAAVRFWYQDHKKGGKRVNCELLGVQFVKDGEAFGKPPFKPEEVFPELDARKEPGKGAPSGGEAAAPDDDEIPF